MDHLFNKQFWEKWISIYKGIKVEPHLTQITKINLKWVKNLNIRIETFQLIEENIGRKIFDMLLTLLFFGYATKS